MKSPDEINRRLEQDEIDEALRKVRFADVAEGCKREPKTLVDIETALEVCKYGCQQCYRCPYANILSEDEDSDECCEDSVKTDALALIQRLEAKNAEQAETIERLNTGVHKLIVKIQQLEAERDAAVREFAGKNCTQCKWLYSESKDSPCLKCYDNEHWQWRGVQKEE